jgi:hypothetical protein
MYGHCSKGTCGLPLAVLPEIPKVVGSEMAFQVQVASGIQMEGDGGTTQGKVAFITPDSSRGVRLKGNEQITNEPIPVYMVQGLVNSGGDEKKVDVFAMDGLTKGTSQHGSAMHTAITKLVSAGAKKAQKSRGAGPRRRRQQGREVRAADLWRRDQRERSRRRGSLSSAECPQ